MNCSASPTETSSRLPERLMPASKSASAALDELDQALQRLQLAVRLVVDARGEQRRCGVGGEQVEQLAILGAENRLVLEELQDHQGSDDRALHREGHHCDRVGAVDGADAQDAIAEGRVDGRIAAGVPSFAIEATRILF